MNWHHQWPFQSRNRVLAYEKAYLAGSYKVDGIQKKSIVIVNECDLKIERWLERDGAERLRKNTSDCEVINRLYLWKTRSTSGCSEAPREILSSEFGCALNIVLNAKDDKMSDAIECLTEFKGIRVRVASAFIYWLRPKEYQIIDRNSTEALNLKFRNDDYTIDNYLRYCRECRKLSKQHCLSLRQIDRALFTYNKLSKKSINIDYGDSALY